MTKRCRHRGKLCPGGTGHPDSTERGWQALLTPPAPGKGGQVCSLLPRPKGTREAEPVASGRTYWDKLILGWRTCNVPLGEQPGQEVTTPRCPSLGKVPSALPSWPLLLLPWVTGASAAQGQWW